MPRLPRLAILLGLAGLLPFLALGFGAAMPDLHRYYVLALLAYGGTILSFLGGVHWGFALVSPAPLPSATIPAPAWPRAERNRLLGGIAASLLGCVAIGTGLFSPAAALALLVAGFAMLTIAESRAVSPGWMPRHYMMLRWALSAVVCLILAAVLILRILGGPH